MGNCPLPTTMAGNNEVVSPLPHYSDFKKNCPEAGFSIQVDAASWDSFHKLQASHVFPTVGNWKLRNPS